MPSQVPYVADHVLHAEPVLRCGMTRAHGRPARGKKETMGSVGDAAMARPYGELQDDKSSPPMAVLALPGRTLDLFETPGQRKVRTTRGEGG